MKNDENVIYHIISDFLPSLLFLFVCTFLCVCDIKIKSDLEVVLEGWLDDKWDTHEEGRTWKPATCNLPTCCVVSIQFYLCWLPTAAAAVLFFCRSLQKLWTLFFPLCLFFFHYLFTFRWSKLNLYVKNTNLFQWLSEISLMLGLVYII